MKDQENIYVKIVEKHYINLQKQDYVFLVYESHIN